MNGVVLPHFYPCTRHIIENVLDPLPVPLLLWLGMRLVQSMVIELMTTNLRHNKYGVLNPT